MSRAERPPAEQTPTRTEQTRTTPVTDVRATARRTGSRSSGDDADPTTLPRRRGRGRSAAVSATGADHVEVASEADFDAPLRRSQRSDGFRGGVQNGSSATSAQSVALESKLRDATKALRPTQPSLAWSSGYDGEELCKLLGVPTDTKISGVRPDGGVWCAAGDPGRPLVVAEAKKQDIAGNAIERWFKNEAVFRRLGTGIYVTFCSGDGFFDDNSSQRIMELAVALDPAEAHRLAAGKVWNTPTGRLWLYRYRSAEQATDLVDVLALALSTASTMVPASPEPTQPVLVHGRVQHDENDAQ